MVISLRQKKIINILKSKDKIITGEGLCADICVSSRTIRSDIKDINKIIEKQGAIIRSEKSKGYYIDVFEEKKFNQFLQKHEDGNDVSNTEDRVEYIIMKLMINEINNVVGITQAELSDELYISLSSLKKDIKLARIVLEKIGLDIEKNGNYGLKVSGSEEYIRRAIVSYLLIQNTYFETEFQKSFEQLFSKKKISEIDEVLKYAIKNNNIRLTDIAYNSFLKDLIVMLFRDHSNKSIKYSNEIIANLKRHEQVHVATNIWNFINMNLEINLCEEEIYYITMHLISSSLMKLSLSIDGGLEHIRQENLIVSKILANILENYQLDLRDDRLLINFLESHLKGAINRAIYNIKIENSMLKGIKNNYQLAFEMGILASKVIKKNLGVSLSEDDIGFVALHFAASLERLKGKNEPNIKRVMLVCTTGVGTSLLLKVKLETKFKDKLAIIDTIPWYEFNEEVIENIDFIITTIPLDVNSKKVIHIKNLLDDKEENLIQQVIDMNPLDEGRLVDNFNENNYTRNLEVNDKWDALDKITKGLIDKGYITEDVKEGIYSREELASTEIGNLVAIPHVIHEDIKETFISVVTFKKKVIWNKENVQVVFIIGLNKKYAHKFKFQLEQLYKKVIDINFVLEIIKAENYNEIIKLIKE